MAKLAFQSIYWHMLLPGREIPGISHELQMHGKKAPAQAGAGREE
jgi:sulfide:quinone oxidoreductase